MIPLETIDPVAATGLFSYAWLMIALPALGAFVLLGFGRYVEKSGPYLAVATITGSFVVAVALFVQMMAAPVAGSRTMARVNARTIVPGSDWGARTLVGVARTISVLPRGLTGRQIPG